MAGAWGAMPSLTLSDRLIWFAHCPKAGGTSIEQLMVARWGDAVGHLHWGWDRWWLKGGWRGADPPNSPQHLVWGDAIQHLAKRPDVVFAVVRDPVARMASEHRYQRRARRGTRVGKALALLPFPIWLRLMLALAERHPYAFDNHFRPQADFVPDGARIFRLEDGLGPVARWLSAVTGESLSDLSLPHALQSGRPVQISEADQALIAEVFAQDYARFGYSRPDPRTTGFGLARCCAWLLVWLDRRGRL